MVLAIAAGYAFVRLREGEFKWEVFLQTFRTLDPAWFFLAGVLMFLSYAVRAFRWRIMLLPLRPDPPLWPVFTATCIGFAAVTLFGRPGEVVRPYLISIRERVPFSSQLAAWLLERIYDLLAVLLIFGYALAHIPADRGNLGPALEWTLKTGGYVAGVIGVFSVAILVAASRFSEATRRRLTDALGFLPPAAHKKAAGLVEAFTTGMSCTRNRAQVLQLLGWTVVEWFLISASTLCLFRSFPVSSDFGWLEVMIFLGFVAFGSIVQIPGVGGGLQVASVLVLTKLFGLHFEPATGIALLFWFISFLVVVPVGLILMVVEGVKLKSLKQISDASVEDPEVAGPAARS